MKESILVAFRPNRGAGSAQLHGRLSVVGKFGRNSFNVIRPKIGSVCLARSLTKRFSQQMTMQKLGLSSDKKIAVIFPHILLGRIVFLERIFSTITPIGLSRRSGSVRQSSLAVGGEDPSRSRAQSQNNEIRR